MSDTNWETRQPNLDLPQIKATTKDPYYRALKIISSAGPNGIQRHEIAARGFKGDTTNVGHYCGYNEIISVNDKPAHKRNLFCRGYVAIGIAGSRKRWYRITPVGTLALRQIDGSFETLDGDRSPALIANDLESPPPERVQTTIARIVRDTALACQIKAFHRFECQICGHAIDLPDGSRYAEGHHMQPLGSPHDGPDVAGNIIVLCPNHHAMLDYGAIAVDLAKLRKHTKHRIGTRFVDYHNSRIHVTAQKGR